MRCGAQIDTVTRLSRSVAKTMKMKKQAQQWCKRAFLSDEDIMERKRWINARPKTMWTVQFSPTIYRASRVYIGTWSVSS